MSLRVLAAELPSPSGLEWWLYERPEGLAIALAVMGVVGLIAFRRRGEVRKGLLALGAGFVLGVLVFAMGWFVETPRERVTALTTKLVRSVATSDRATVDAILAPEVIVASAGQIVSSQFGRQEILAAVDGFEWFKIDEWYQRSDGAVIDGPNSARTRAVVRVRSSYYDTLLVPMTWEFTWQRVAGSQNAGTEGDRWVLTRLELLTMWGREPPNRWAEMARAAGRWSTSGGQDDNMFPSNLTRDAR